MSVPTALVLFGPQETHWTAQNLHSLQLELNHDERFKFLKDVMKSLPSLEPFLSQHLGFDTNDVATRNNLQQLGNFLTQDELQNISQLGVCNTYQATLTVVHHVVEFIKWAQLKENDSEFPIIENVQGFCIGFLSAATVASANSWQELEDNAICAVRLAACIGAIVDRENAAGIDAIALSVRWKTETQRPFVEMCINGIPDAYISCWTDEKTATVTVPRRYENSFKTQVSEKGIVCQSIGLQGRFHSPVHLKVAGSLKAACSTTEGIRFPNGGNLRIPLRSTADTEIIQAGSLTDLAVDIALCECAYWYQTVERAAELLPDSTRPEEVICFGRSARIPRSINRAQGKRAVKSSTGGYYSPDEKVAVVGMGCRFPQADDLDEFWQLIKTGSTAVGEIPSKRFDPSCLAREPKLPSYHGNFLRAPGVLDHRFFKISGREAKSMDPQQRLALQVAYEALESSGYHGYSDDKQERDVGVYLGVGAVDYEANVAFEDAGAFSATGTLRAFISGRISHFFGWSGPSITFDTACSSSAVAIHSACRALIANECAMAVAGGVNVITSPILHQNLAAASFLNPGGSSKAFDATANGYCRGEGAGLLILKPLSRAVADGDTIIGVIAGSAVNQGANCSPITVPHSDSQSAIYRKSLAMGGIDPAEVTYVEAHGTGTKVGDPIEYESVRSTLTGPWRSENLFLGSVKDNIGHAEAASGAAGVIKTLLMMQHRLIPIQANFRTLNPRISTSSADKMTVPRETQPWIPGSNGRLVALINNYGAAGSNAAIVVHEYINQKTRVVESMAASERSISYPILVAAKSHQSLVSYLDALRSVRIARQDDTNGIPTGNLSQAVNLRQNVSFKHRAAYTFHDANSWQESLEKASQFSEEETDLRKEVVLCFGGQTGRRSALSRTLYEHSELLRYHVDKCDALSVQLGLPKLLPGLFDSNLNDANNDIVASQCSLFTLQYASAMTWLDAGLKVDTLIGHSFGQLTALCVAGSLSLEDSLRFVGGRARLMRDAWHDERGIMLSVECDRDCLDNAIEDCSRQGARLDIACYNGPRSFVVAGDNASISRLENIFSSRKDMGKDSHSTSPKIRMSRLESSHAFHSYLTAGILPALKDLARSMHVKPPNMRIETCSEGETWSHFSTEVIAEHTRKPVYFHEAVKRIEKRFPGGAVWLEAGASSPVIAMANRILDSTKRHSMISVDSLGGVEGTGNIASAACKLWMTGKGNHFWISQIPQSRDHAARVKAILATPSYQFEKTEHWIPYKAARLVNEQESLVAKSSQVDEPCLVKLLEKSSDTALFAVDTACRMFQLTVRGHAVAGQSLCPASMYIELATRCATSIYLEAMADSREELLPQIQDLEMSAPLGINTQPDVLVRVSGIGLPGDALRFTIFSRSSGGNQTQHASGYISLHAREDTTAESRTRLLRRLARGPARAKKLLSSPEGGICGSMVYRTFEEVVTYASYYHGVQTISAQRNESAGRVKLPSPDHLALTLHDQSIRDPIALDNFLQVAGIHVNCLSERAGGQVFMCVGIDEVVFTSGFVGNVESFDERAWIVHSHFEEVNDANKGPQVVTNNIFVYDEASGNLMLCIIGATFRSVLFKSVVRSLSRLNAQTTESTTLKKENTVEQPYEDSGYQTRATATPNDQALSIDPMTPESSDLDPVYPRDSQGPELLSILNRLRTTMAGIIEMPSHEILPTSKLEVLGIDSLLVTEVITEIQKQFNISVDKNAFLDLETVFDVSHYISRLTTGELTQAHDRRAPIQVKSNTTLIDVQSSNLQPQKVTSVVGNETGRNHINPSASQIRFDHSKAFGNINSACDRFVKETGFANFYDRTFPLQSELVLRYVVEAFSTLDCDLGALSVGAQVPLVQHVATHDKLVTQLYKILMEGGLIRRNAEEPGFCRTTKPAPPTPSSELHGRLLSEFPQHTSETKLLATTAQNLAECLSGTADPIALLFGSPAARALLEDVYSNAPLFLAKTRVLAQYLCEVLASTTRAEPRSEVRILEIGAGTGGTTRYLLEALAAQSADVDVVYTFTDLSASLVATAKRKFARFAGPRFRVEFSVLDLEAETLPSWVVGMADIIVSTNCVHATRDLARSTANIRSMLRPDYEAMLCLVELMPRDLYWFDLVFGLLEGWWLFEDGRTYALADERHWEKILRGAGFRWVDWTRGPSREAAVIRVISASLHQALTKHEEEAIGVAAELVRKETMTYKKVGDLDLHADIYYPSEVVDSGRKLPIALMIHGGGHVLLSRNDIRPEQTQWLLRDGFLPVSIDYRLCPETTLINGPMTDAADALNWARNTLPTLQSTLRRPDVVLDGTRVVVIGWSTGGTLAMSLGWTGLCRPPDAILAFYCPQDYEDTFWRLPNQPEAYSQAVARYGGYVLDASIRDACNGPPIAGYNIAPTDAQPSAVGGWMAPSDPRSRLLLYMNWHGQTLDVLLRGKSALEDGAEKQAVGVDAVMVRSVSPLARIRAGDYAAVPTFLIYPSDDDLVPLAQAQRVHQALLERGIDAQLRVVEGRQHLFDVYPRWKADQAALAAVLEGYEFLRATVFHST